MTGKDIHVLDHDGDGIACESLPPGLPPTATPAPTTTPAPSDTPQPTATPLPQDTPTPASTPIPNDQGQSLEPEVLAAIIGVGGVVLATVLGAVITDILGQRRDQRRGAPPLPPDKP